jgi:hypothetical protein
VVGLSSNNDGLRSEGSSDLRTEPIAARTPAIVLVAAQRDLRAGVTPDAIQQCHRRLRGQLAEPHARSSPALRPSRPPARRTPMARSIDPQHRVAIAGATSTSIFPHPVHLRRIRRAAPQDGEHARTQHRPQRMLRRRSRSRPLALWITIPPRKGSLHDSYGPQLPHRGALRKLWMRISQKRCGPRYWRSIYGTATPLVHEVYTHRAELRNITLTGQASSRTPTAMPGATAIRRVPRRNCGTRLDLRAAAAQVERSSSS